MTHHFYFLRNRPVLAYPKCNTKDPVSLLLDITYNDSPAQCTLSMRNDARNFILNIDADNIASDSLPLEPALIPVPQARLEEIARSGNPQLRTLCLKLKQPCTLWGSPSGVETPSEGLLNLAKVTELDILFDYNWLHRDKHAQFERLLEQPQLFSGVSLDQHYSKLYKRVDWTDFSIGHDEAHTETDVTTDDNEPPPEYTVANAKRPRHVSIGSASDSPPAKRPLLLCLETQYASPTEKGNTWTPSPKLVPSPTTPSPKSPALIAPSAGTPSITASSPIPPHSLAVPTTNTQLDAPQTVQQTALDALPSMVQVHVANALGSLLTRLLAASSPSQPLSQTSNTSLRADTPPTGALPTFSNTHIERLARRIEAKLGGIYESTLGDADYIRNAADLEFEEMLEERRLDLGLQKEDATLEVERVIQEKLKALKEQCDDLTDYVQDRAGHVADDVVDNAKQRLDELGHKASLSLEHTRVAPENEREELNRLREKLTREKEEFWRDMSRERADLRRERKSLRRERRRFESERRVARESALGVPGSSTATLRG